jgi:hypothetical protein
MPVPLTEPLPVPLVATVSVRDRSVKTAVQDLAASIVTEPSLQSASPVQLVKLELAESAVAVSVTTVPWL